MKWIVRLVVAVEAESYDAAIDKVLTEGAHTSGARQISATHQKTGRCFRRVLPDGASMYKTEVSE